MAIVSYTPGFQHENWVDNVDRVQAGGPNGFNIRFNAIEGEFQKIEQAVHAIDTALGSLGEQVRAPVTVGLSPILLPFGGMAQWGGISWGHLTTEGVRLGTFVSKPGGQEQAWGILPLSLPDGVRLTELKVLGEQTGAGDMRTSLFQEARTEPFTQATLVTVKGLGGGATAPTAIPGTPTIDAAANLYYLMVTASNAAPNTTIRFRGCQLTYQP